MSNIFYRYKKHGKTDKIKPANKNKTNNYPGYSNIRAGCLLCGVFISEMPDKGVINFMDMLCV